MKADLSPARRASRRWVRQVKTAAAATSSAITPSPPCRKARRALSAATILSGLTWRRAKARAPSSSTVSARTCSPRRSPPRSSRKALGDELARAGGAPQALLQVPARQEARADAAARLPAQQEEPAGRLPLGAPGERRQLAFRRGRRRVLESEGAQQRPRPAVLLGAAHLRRQAAVALELALQRRPQARCLAGPGGGGQGLVRRQRQPAGGPRAADLRQQAPALGGLGQGRQRRQRAQHVVGGVALGVEPAAGRAQLAPGRAHRALVAAPRREPQPAQGQLGGARRVVLLLRGLVQVVLRRRQLALRFAAQGLGEQQVEGHVPAGARQGQVPRRRTLDVQLEPLVPAHELGRRGVEELLPAGDALPLLDEPVGHAAGHPRDGGLPQESGVVADPRRRQGQRRGGERAGHQRGDPPARFRCAPSAHPRSVGPGVPRDVNAVSSPVAPLPVGP